jgi:hypothetical protein
MSNVPQFLNIVGISFDIFGAFFVATEVVKQFSGDSFKGHEGISFDSSFTAVPPSKKTEEFEFWERRKFRNMKIGLSFLVIGFGLQIFANILQIQLA